MKRHLHSLSLVLLAAATLTACTPKNSLERHTRHYVYASDDRSDPNFYTRKADTIRMMVPFFRQFRVMWLNKPDTKLTSIAEVFSEQEKTIYS
ncbi:Exc2 family lipoprotein [Salmonella enterica subsp. enterica serovar Uzaramo]|uniref:Exc2 family lipoprotein n=1 Tax=Salmonella enterica TaxID=28901 RepID=A0A760ABW9_SALER|nr:Exc2 family lipoprotein [Salmonella enterica]EEE9947716.1 Exc2 family lipoprotein [Salmonella enterica subsp. enterica serovar Uzaramo]EIM5533190.1 Exc2 family lipoprotein [Salmonella enterica subsp. enterica]EEM9513030.1 Exc2 family lipoprotein [Salmonella enterica]ELQ0398962.1 Exc2 family lipoprotein [Salmonella enterica]